MRKRLIYLLTFLALLITGAVFSQNVKAEANMQTYDVYYTDSTETEKIPAELVVNQSIQPAIQTYAASSNIRVNIWMQVATKFGGAPQLNKYWHVKYVNGKKYQGYVYWTGKKRIIKHAPVQFQFEFSGVLNRA